MGPQAWLLQLQLERSLANGARNSSQRAAFNILYTIEQTNVMLILYVRCEKKRNYLKHKSLKARVMDKARVTFAGARLDPLFVGIVVADVTGFLAHLDKLIKITFTSGNKQLK